MEGQNVLCNFAGGGGKHTVECALQNQFWRAQNVGWVWSEEMRGRGQTGGKRVIGLAAQKSHRKIAVTTVAASGLATIPLQTSLKVFRFAGRKKNASVLGGYLQNRRMRQKLAGTTAANRRSRAISRPQRQRDTKIIGGGGPKAFSGRRYGMFSPPVSFPPPFAAL